MEKFEDRVKSVNGVLIVSIPYKQARFAGIEKDDRVVVMIKKVPEFTKNE